MLDTFCLGNPIIQSSYKNHWVSEPRISEIAIGDRISTVPGSTVVIKCPFRGNPYPRVTWFFNNNVVDHVKLENVYLTEPDGVSVLKISNISSSLVGKFKCLVFNRNGRKEETSMVRLIGIPWIV